MAALRRDGEIRLAGRDALTLRLHARAEPLGLAGAGCLTVRITDPNRERERPTAARLRARLGLTRRQAEALAALATGATEKEAAETLGLGAPTLDTHVRRAYEKLDLRSRADLVALLARHGFETARTPK
jgi:DNA-binding CsgD family transcriptional regulator